MNTEILKSIYDIKIIKDDKFSLLYYIKQNLNFALEKTYQNMFWHIKGDSIKIMVYPSDSEEIKTFKKKISIRLTAKKKEICFKNPVINNSIPKIIDINNKLMEVKGEISSNPTILELDYMKKETYYCEVLNLTDPFSRILLDKDCGIQMADIIDKKIIDDNIYLLMDKFENLENIKYRKIYIIDPLIELILKSDEIGCHCYDLDLKNVVKINGEIKLINFGCILFGKDIKTSLFELYKCIKDIQQ